MMTMKTDLMLLCRCIKYDEDEEPIYRQRHDMLYAQEQIKLLCTIKPEYYKLMNENVRMMMEDV